MGKLRGSDLLVRLLEVNEAKYIFGIPGGHLLKFYDSLFNSKILHPILTKHESGASFIATGFAQVSGKIGVCTGTVGPGATNLVTGVASAYMDSIPVLVITAQVGKGTVGRGALQEATGEGRTADHVEIFDGITKYATRVYNIGRLTRAFAGAITTAINGRPGPAHLDIMADVFSSEIEIDESTIEKTQQFPLIGEQGAINRAKELILASKNPAILAGAGAMEASDEIIKLAEMMNIPVATTLRGKGVIPEDHRLCIGTVGLYGTNIANKYLHSEIDVLLAVGTSFSEFTTHAWDPRFQPSVALIQIDVDAQEIGKNYPVAVGILGSSKHVISRLVSMIESEKLQERANNEEKISRLKVERQYFSDPKMDSEDTPLKPQRFMKSLRECLPRDTIVFGDIGNTVTWIESFFTIYEPKTFFICSTLASMGYGVAASIGGKLAAPDRQVVCICGDGDFQQQGMEVVTAVNYNIPVKWFILNNQCLAMIRDIQDILFKGRRIASEFTNPDYVKLAEAMGAAGYRITRPDQIKPTVEETLSNGKPTVVDVVIDPKEIPSFDARAEAMIRAWGVAPPLYQKLKMIPEFLKRR